MGVGVRQCGGGPTHTGIIGAGPGFHSVIHIEIVMGYMESQEVKDHMDSADALQV